MANLVGFTADDVRRQAINTAMEIDRSMSKWKAFADKLSTLTEQELTDMGLSSEFITYLGSFRVSILNIELRYRNQEPLDTTDPSYFVKMFTPLG